MKRMQKLNSRIKISWKIKIFLYCLFALFQIGNGIVGPSTVYDGVTYNRNTYIRFNGNTGIKFEDTTLPEMTEFSTSLWLRFEVMPSTYGKDMTVLHFGPSGFYC